MPKKVVEVSSLGPSWHLKPFRDKEELDDASEKEEFNLFLSELQLSLPLSSALSFC